MLVSRQLGSHPSVGSALAQMILPGHVAASVLCHRYLKAELRVALIAGVIPDVVDKLLYHVFRLVPSSRVPMHTLVAWVTSTLLVATVAWLVPRGQVRGWAVAWLLSYGAHLLCDSPLLGGELPFLYPFWHYDFRSPAVPLSFLFGLDPWPVRMLVAELLLTLFTLYVERERILAVGSRLFRRRGELQLPDRN